MSNKKTLTVIAAMVAIVVGSMALTSCDPDDVDAFAKGYRDGYYGTYSSSESGNNIDAIPSVESVDIDE